MLRPRNRRALDAAAPPELPPLARRCPLSTAPSVRARFERLVAELRAHPEVEVFASEIRPGATADQIARAEAELGVKLPAAMRGFYAEANGLFLEWGTRGSDREELTSPFGYPDYGQPVGCINLLPVEHVMSTEWEESCHVNEIQDDHWEALYGAVPDPRPVVGAVCFDNYSKYHHGDLILGPEPVVVVCTDHGADMDSSDSTDFANYLEATLSLYGLCRYTHAFGIGWTRRSAPAPTWTRRLSLDEVVALARKDAE